MDSANNPSSGRRSRASLALESTIALLARARRGETGALDAVLERSMPPLRKWARGKLPASARGLLETQDLIQESVIRFVRRVPSFVARGPGAVQAYLRRSVVNLIRDAMRTVARRPAGVALDDVHAAPGTSPLEQAIGREQTALYESALQRLSLKDRSAIVARLQHQQSYEEIAVALGKPTANAARVAVIRALYRLSREMRHGA